MSTSRHAVWSMLTSTKLAGHRGAARGARDLVIGAVQESTILGLHPIPFEYHPYKRVNPSGLT